MEWTSSEVTNVITYLLPGFVSAWVFYGLTAHARPAPFERVVQALIFTPIVQPIVTLVRWGLLVLGRFIVVGRWTDDVRVGWSLVVAVSIGLVVARFANNDRVHKLLRAFNWTSRTSFPSEWFGVFNQAGRYVVLHLSGERRLYGWPEEWPDQPDRGHFVIAEPEWLLDGGDRCRLENVWNILIPAIDVEMIEFMYNEKDTALRLQMEGETGHDSKSSTAAT
jgi:Family of unknown function (DUF6338)